MMYKHAIKLVPGTDMLLSVLAEVPPRHIDDLLDLAHLVEDVDHGHLTIQTVTT